MTMKNQRLEIRKIARNLPHTSKHLESNGTSQKQPEGKHSEENGVSPKVNPQPSTSSTITSNPTPSTSKSNGVPKVSKLPKIVEHPNVNCNGKSKCGVRRYAEVGTNVSLSEQRLHLIEQLHDLSNPLSIAEIDYLRDKEIKLQLKISQKVEAGRLNLEKRRQLQRQKVDDYYYEKHGFVLIEEEEASPGTFKSFVDCNNKSKSWGECVQTHDHEQMEEELKRLRKRLEKLGKSLQSQVEIGEEAAEVEEDANTSQNQNNKSEPKTKIAQKKKDSKCSIM